MITPTDISTEDFQPNDYAYAGALFALHSLYSYNAQKKYGFQTEILAGVRGPASFGKQVQTGVHGLIDYQKPKGWDNQLRNMPLININFTAEKQFLSVGNFMEINGGSLVRAGSLMDGVFMYPMIRIGQMSPYFDGYLNQFGSFEREGKRIKTQYYFVFKPIGSFIAYDALFQGKRENETRDNYKYETNESRNIQHLISDIQVGAVVARGGAVGAQPDGGGDAHAQRSHRGAGVGGGGRLDLAGRAAREANDGANARAPTARSVPGRTPAAAFTMP